jgi:hypothetical protein
MSVGRVSGYFIVVKGNGETGKNNKLLFCDVLKKRTIQRQQQGSKSVQVLY